MTTTTLPCSQASLDVGEPIYATAAEKTDVWLLLEHDGQWAPKVLESPGLAPRTRAWLDLVALLLLGIFVAAVVERAFDVSWTSLTEVIRSNTNLRIPLAWAQIPWLAGLVLFGLTIAVAFLRGAVALARGDLPAVAATIGIASQDEEIASELEGLGIAVHQDKDH